MLTMNDGGDRYYSWNFTNFEEGQTGTVEYRQAPGVVNAQDCLQWVELVHR